MNAEIRLPSVDSFSALVDRLIIEHIKRFEFARTGDDAAVLFQNSIIGQLRIRLTDCLICCLQEHNYNYADEIRTFISTSMTPRLEALIVSNALLGVAEREKIAEVLCDDPSVERLTALIAVARVANESRAQTKQQIDRSLKAVIQADFGVEGDRPSEKT